MQGEFGNLLIPAITNKKTSLLLPLYNFSFKHFNTEFFLFYFLKNLIIIGGVWSSLGKCGSQGSQDHSSFFGSVCVF